MLKQQVYKIEMLPTKELKPAGFNPRGRTTSKRMKRLEAAIKRAGEIILPIVVSRDGFILDGHRRWTIAQRLGWDYVPCIVVPYGLQEGWTILNAGSEPLKPGDYVQAVAQGLDISFVEGDTGRNIRDVYRVAGADAIQVLADKDISPRVMDMARRLGSYLGDTSDGTLAVLLHWIIKYKMSFFVRRLPDLLPAPASIWAAVRDDRPLELK